MAPPAPTYDLMLMLDPKAEDSVKAKIRSDVRATIESAGTLLNSAEYGARKMAFEIDHETEAEYELLQFEGPKTLLDELNRTLRITDGVVRFRIIKLAPGTPEPPEPARADRPAVETADAAA